MPPQVIAFIALIIGGVVLMSIIGLFRFRRRVGPNEVLVISGRENKFVTVTGEVQKRGFRIIRGGGCWVIPVLEKAQKMSLELMTLDVKTPEVYTIQGVPIIVDGIAQIKVKNDDFSISTAAEQFLNKPSKVIQQIALQTLEGHLRAILGTMTVEEVYKDRETFAREATKIAEADLANMGLTIVSFTIRDIRDNEGYLEALGKPQIARVRKDAIIGEAEAKRDATQKAAAADRVGKEAEFVAKTKIAEAERNYKLKQEEFNGEVNQKKAEADLSYELQKYTTGQLVKEQEMMVRLVEKNKEIELQEAEIQRKEKELTALVNKPALAEKKKIETLSDAEKYRLTTTAEGEAARTKQKGFADAEVVERDGVADASANKAQGLANAEVKKALGLAEAEVVRAQGLAEAEAIKAKGLAEAEAMNKKADAWKEYGEAAMIQLLIDKLPEIASAVSAPLSKMDKMVVISTDGATGGASRVTGDVATVMAQLPPIVESLSGIDLLELMKRVTNKTGEVKNVDKTKT